MARSQSSESHSPAGTREESLQAEVARLTRKVEFLERNLKEQVRSQRESREVFYSDLSRVMAIIDDLVDGIVFTDPAGKVILINPSAGRVLGTPNFVALGKDLPTVPANQQILSVLLAQREGDLEVGDVSEEICVRGGKAGEGHFIVNTSAVFDVQGRLCGNLSLIRDISLRKKTEHLKNQFLSIVAHELRTPLTAIKAFATILSRGIRGEPPEAHRPILNDIVSQTGRLEHEIDKIINLGRLEQSDFAPDLRVAYASDIVGRIVAPFEAQAKEKEIDLTVKNDAGDAKIEIDVRDIKRAIAALLENALKFTPDGGSVEVCVRVKDGHVLYEIKDTGIGIAPSDQSIIFDKFIQLENPLTRQFGGSGLGLSFAAAIIDAQRSTIEVDSEPGKGSCFRFRIPIVGYEDGLDAPTLGTGAKDAKTETPK